MSYITTGILVQVNMLKGITFLCTLMSVALSLGTFTPYQIPDMFLRPYSAIDIIF